MLSLKGWIVIKSGYSIFVVNSSNVVARFERT